MISKDTGKAHTSETSSAEASTESSVCVVDLGKQSRKRVKGLKRGKGRLMKKVDNVVRDLVEENVVPEGAAVVVIVVQKKNRAMMSMFRN